MGATMTTIRCGLLATAAFLTIVSFGSYSTEAAVMPRIPTSRPSIPVSRPSIPISRPISRPVSMPKTTVPRTTFKPRPTTIARPTARPTSPQVRHAPKPTSRPIPNTTNNQIVAKHPPIRCQGVRPCGPLKTPPGPPTPAPPIPQQTKLPGSNIPTAPRPVPGYVRPAVGVASGGLSASEWAAP